MLSCEECRRADQIAIKRFGIPSLVLMENAGRSCAEKLLWHSAQSELSEQAVLILCGPGNNGGDGLVMARHLYCLGIRVKIILFGSSESYRGDAKLNLDSLSRLKMPVVEFDSQWSDEKLKNVFGKVRRAATTWVVDALLGTGASGEPRLPMSRAISVANGMDVRRFAVDIPTGLNGDTGVASKVTFRAHLTSTFIAMKPGIGDNMAEEFVGLISLVEIGIPPDVIRVLSQE